MPSVSVYPPISSANYADNEVGNPLPSLLHTPSGLAVVEIQGSILSEEGLADVSTALDLGRLVFPAADEDADSGEWDGKRVYLFIGKHQRMTGEVRKLSKPLAAMRRKAVSADDANGEQVEITDIVRYKMLFAHRPEPVGVELVLGDQAS